MYDQTSVVEDIAMVRTPDGKELGDPEDWPVEEAPEEGPIEGKDPEMPESVERRETGDADDPAPTGREGLAGRK
jgi:hypothetical protein